MREHATVRARPAAVPRPRLRPWSQLPAQLHLTLTQPRDRSCQRDGHEPGYTRLTQERGDAAAADPATRLARLVERTSVRHGGRPVKWLGDGVMFFFKDPGPGVVAALEMVSWPRWGCRRRTWACTPDRAEVAFREIGRVELKCVRGRA